MSKMNIKKYNIMKIWKDYKIKLKLFKKISKT